MSDEKIRILYISGAGRSGSTLLAQMLAQLDGFTAAGELRHFWERGMLKNQLCSCGEPFHACPFWQDVVTILESDSKSVDAEKMLRTRQAFSGKRWLFRSLRMGRTPDDSIADDYVQNLSSLFRAVSEVAGNRIIVDSSKNPSDVRTLRRLLNCEVYVLHLVRDSRAVAHAWTKKKRRPEIPDEDVSFKRYPPFITAIRWALHKNLLTEWISQGKRAYLRLRYEDLVLNPRESLESVLAFTHQDKVELSPRFLDGGFIIEEPSHMVSGNPVRFSKGQIRLELDDEWKRKMDPLQKAVVTLLTFLLLFRYGYLRRYREDREK